MLHAETPQLKPVAKLSFTFLYHFQLATMTNKIRAARSSATPVSRTGNQERILQDQYLLFHTDYNHKNPGRAGSIKEVPSHTQYQLFSWLDCKVPPLSLTLRENSTLAAIISNVDSSPQSCDHIRQIVVEEAAQEHVTQPRQATQQGVENVTSSIFFTCYIEAERGLKKVFHRFIDTVIIYLAVNGTSDELFDRSTLQ